MVRQASETHEEGTPDSGAGPDFSLDRHLFFWTTQLLVRRDRQLAAALKSTGVRVPEWRVLASLHSRKRLSMSELADLSNIERATLSRTADRMVRAGWVSRLTDTSDGRVTPLALTAEGERLFVRIWPMVRAVNEAAVAGVPAPAVELVRWALEQMCRNFDAPATTDSRRDVA
jgi:MarR family transcriptional regulator, multiple antibiotic resistance protein MarR